MTERRALTPEEIEAALNCWTEGPEQPFQKYEPIPFTAADEAICSLGRKIYNTIKGYNNLNSINNMKVKFKKLVPGAILPKKATEGSAAYDLYVPEDIIIKSGRQIILLGFAMEMKQGYEALIDPRSGFSSKGMEGYEVLYISILDTPFGTIESFAKDNKPEDSSEIIKTYTALDPERFDCDVIEGKIDADYRDGVGVIVHNHGPEFLVKAGTRIAQMTFHKVETVEWEETDTLSETDRDGGFGSTGTK